MAQYLEAMEIDDIENDFDNKENAFHHTNVQSCTEKGYEELDVSELNMKLRYSITPTSSPMSKSFTANRLDNRIFDLNENLPTITGKDSQNIMTKSDTTNKSSKITPLLLLHADQSEDSNRMSSALTPLDSTYISSNNVKVAIIAPTGDEDLFLPSIPSSSTHTPEATTPIKEVPKHNEGSPIMRGLKSVFNMFRSSQSPTSSAGQTESTTYVSPSHLSLQNDNTVQDNHKVLTVLASTPCNSKNKDVNSLKRISPLKESIVFNDDLEKELQWKDETMIFFSNEKIPVHKLFFQPTGVDPQNGEDKIPIKKLDSTVEFMDISYNDDLLKNKTLTEVLGNNPDSSNSTESDGEFVDCETTFSKNESQDNKETNDVISKVFDTVNENSHDSFNNQNIHPLEVIEQLPTNIPISDVIAQDDTLPTLQSVHLERIVTNISSKIEGTNENKDSCDRELAEQNYVDSKVEDTLEKINNCNIEATNSIQLRNCIPCAVEDNNHTKILLNITESSSSNNISCRYESVFEQSKNNETMNLKPRIPDNKHTAIKPAPLPEYNAFLSNVSKDTNKVEHEGTNTLSSNEKNIESNCLDVDSEVKRTQDNILDSEAEMQNITLIAKNNYVSTVDNVSANNDVSCSTINNLSGTLVSTSNNKVIEYISDKKDEPGDKSKITGAEQITNIIKQELLEHEHDSTSISAINNKLVLDVNNLGVINDRELKCLDTNKMDTTINKALEENKPSNVSTENIKNTDISSSGDSVYYSIGTSSTEVTKSKNVFNLPEIDDINFNPFMTKNKLAQSTDDKSLFYPSDNISLSNDKHDNISDKNLSLTNTSTTPSNSLPIIYDKCKLRTQMLQEEHNRKKNLETYEYDTSKPIILSNNTDEIYTDRVRIDSEVKFHDPTNITDLETSDIGIQNVTSIDSNTCICSVDNLEINVGELCSIQKQNQSDMLLQNENQNNCDKINYVETADNKSALQNKFEQNTSNTEKDSRDEFKMIEKEIIADQGHNSKSVHELMMSKPSTPCGFVQNQDNVYPELDCENIDNNNSISQNTNLSISLQISPQDTKQFNINFEENGDTFAEIQMPPIQTQSLNHLQEKKKENNIHNEMSMISIEHQNSTGTMHNNDTNTLETLNCPQILLPLDINNVDVLNDKELKCLDSPNKKDTTNTFSNSGSIEIVDDRELKCLDAVSKKEDLNGISNSELIIKQGMSEVKFDDIPSDVGKTLKENECFFNVSIENIKNTDKSCSQHSVYYTIGKSSTEAAESKNVFNLPEIDDVNFNPFMTKNKLAQSTEDKDLIYPCCYTQDNADTKTASPLKDLLVNNDITNTINTTCSSKTTDDKDDTVREINTEDEDTIEGPFLDTEDLINDDIEFGSNKVQFTDLPPQSNDEAGEMFIDAQTFEFLMNQNANEVSDSGKESLFLKFDPLFAKKVKYDSKVTSLTTMQKEHSHPTASNNHDQQSGPFDKTDYASSHVETLTMNNDGDIIKLVGENSKDFNITLSKPIMAVPPAINPITTPRNNNTTPPRDNRRSVPFSSPAMAVIDRLLSLSANNSMINNEISLNAEQDEANLVLMQLREVLAEKESHVQQLQLEREGLKDRFAILESNMQSLEIEVEERRKRVKELNDQLAEKTSLNKSMSTVMEEYERTIASLIADTVQDSKIHAEEKRRLTMERDEQAAHLASMEVTFSDAHAKYEKSKQVIQSYRDNEERYKNINKKNEENFAKMLKNYDLLKQHATSNLNHANQELDKLKRSHEAEILKYNAIIKRKDLYITSLEENITQKTKANEELTAICDELLNKVA